MAEILCPTCGGKGSIPDPQCQDQTMCYLGPRGETVPEVTCRTCGGSGWVQEGRSGGEEE